MIPIDQMIKIVGRWTVTVEMEYVADNQPIAAANNQSSIQPLMLPDGSWDQRALDEYEDFVVNVLEIFEYYDFSIIESRESPYSQSKYYALVKKGDEDRKDYKYILYVRVSDHDLDRSRTRRQKEWFDEHAQQQKQPSTKSKQRWKLKRITVNKDTYFSYDEALDDLEEKLHSMQ